MNGLATAALVVLAAMSVLWTLLLIILAAELRRTTRQAQLFLGAMQSELIPALAEARETFRTATRVAQDLGEVTPHLQATIGALEEVSENVRGATGAVRSLFGHRFIPVAGLLAGVRAGLRFAWRHYSRRRDS